MGEFDGPATYGSKIALAIASVELVFLALAVTGIVRVTSTRYQYACMVALLALVAFLFSRASFAVNLSSGLGKIAVVVFLYVVLTPVLLLIEAGAAAYLAFEGPLRYAGLGMVILGSIAAVAFIIRFLLRLRKLTWD